MKLSLPIVVKEPGVTKDSKELADVPFVEYHDVEDEAFLDGPVSRRVAVLDFDPKTGRLTRGVRFREGHASYAIPPPRTPADLARPDVIRVTTFAAVHRTLGLFEEEDSLGRKVQWAFPGEQILVVPRAGEWANAFYERESRSLQFFFAKDGDGNVLHTCNSQDIVSHETAHAVIDAVAPDLYHSQGTQGLAIHEALADIATLLAAFRTHKLAQKVLSNAGGSLAKPSDFNMIAPKLGELLNADGRVLRTLVHRHTMKNPKIDHDNPHSLSQVLSGALYDLMVDIYEGVRGRSPERKAGQDSSDLWVASRRFQRTILRALDYLPPGEVTFSDFGRAMWASDQASHPESAQQRDAMAQHFLRRKIIKSPRELEVETNFTAKPVSDLDLEQLLQSDWVAHEFASQNRDLLHIPPGIPFEVRPRLDVVKKYYHRDAQDRRVQAWVRELLFKVTWSIAEPCGTGRGMPKRREVRGGTTLAIEWDRQEHLASNAPRKVVWGRGRPQRKVVRAILTNEGGAKDRAGRDSFLRRMVDDDVVAADDAAYGPDGERLRGLVRVETTGGTLRMGATARALHLARGRA